MNASHTYRQLVQEQTSARTLLEVAEWTQLKHPTLCPHVEDGWRIKGRSDVLRFQWVPTSFNDGAVVNPFCFLNLLLHIMLCDTGIALWRM